MLLFNFSVRQILQTLYLCLVWIQFMWLKFWLTSFKKLLYIFKAALTWMCCRCPLTAFPQIPFRYIVLDGVIRQVFIHSVPPVALMVENHLHVTAKDQGKIVIRDSTGVWALLPPLYCMMEGTSFLSFASSMFCLSPTVSYSIFLRRFHSVGQNVWP